MKKSSLVPSLSKLKENQQFYLLSTIFLYMYWIEDIFQMYEHGKKETWMVIWRNNAKILNTEIHWRPPVSQVLFRNL